LTGFKWIANRALQLEIESGANFVFGYEEALGYTVGTHVRDKDGISAAVVFADLAAWCRARGGTVIDELEHCWRRYGMFMSEQIAVVLPGAEGAARIQAIMNAVRAQPPWQLDSEQVLAVEDLQAGTRTTAMADSISLSYPPSNVIILDLGDGGRVMLRPSGTEPKIKYYVDVRVDLEELGSIDAATQAGRRRIETLVSALDAAIGVGGPLTG
jgi:phosphomannomutase